jgi:hypothetical protein
MKIVGKALLWSVGFEAFLILLAFGGRVGMPFVSYLALAFHFPAICLLDAWPAAQATLIGPILAQWCIWLLGFTAFFALRQALQRKPSGHETNATF